MIWTSNDFKGMYSVPTAAITEADTEEQAKQNIRDAMSESVDIGEAFTVTPYVGGTVILSNGNY